MREHIRTWKFTYAILGILFFLAFCGGGQRMAYAQRQLTVLCDDVTWLPHPCNEDAPLPDFQGDAQKFTEWLLASQSDILEGQDETVKQAITEVMRSVGGLSYSVGYQNGLKEKGEEK